MTNRLPPHPHPPTPQADVPAATALQLSQQARLLVERCLPPSDPAVLAAACSLADADEGAEAPAGDAPEGGDARGGPPAEAAAVQLFTLGEVVAVAPLAPSSSSIRQAVMSAAGTAAAGALQQRPGLGAVAARLTQQAQQGGTTGGARGNRHADVAAAWQAQVQLLLQPAQVGGRGGGRQAGTGGAAAGVLAGCCDPLHRLSAAQCERALRAGLQAYHASGLPQRYAAQVHAAALQRAVAAYDRQAAGPARSEFRGKLRGSCLAVWAAERQLCGAGSLTGRVCARAPHGQQQQEQQEQQSAEKQQQEQQHESADQLQLPTLDGSSLLTQPDWYDLSAANLPDQRARPSSGAGGAACSLHPITLGALGSGSQAPGVAGPAAPQLPARQLLLGPWVSLWCWKQGGGSGSSSSSSQPAGAAYDPAVGLQQPGFVMPALLSRLPLLLPARPSSDVSPTDAAAAAAAARAAATQLPPPREGRTAASVVAGKAGSGGEAFVLSDFPTLAQATGKRGGAAPGGGGGAAAAPGLPAGPAGRQAAGGKQAVGGEGAVDAAAGVAEAWQRLVLGSGSQQAAGGAGVVDLAPDMYIGGQLEGSWRAAGGQLAGSWGGREGKELHVL
jgi:hypothetical protein